MRRLLILHCGPMKTGSTFIQDTLKFHHQALLEAELAIIMCGPNRFNLIWGK